MNNERNRFGGRKGRFLFPFFAPLLIFLLAAVVMGLWNATLPQLLSVNRIGYWQALGLFLLCRILFGGFGFKGRNGRFEGGRNGWEGWRGKWQNMTEEERANFKEQWRKRCEERKNRNQQ